MKILVLNGPNLNLLGTREPDVYGSATLDDLQVKIESAFPDIAFAFQQSNSESELIEALHRTNDGSFAGVIINPGGFSHTSVALRDAISGIATPVVEVHISNVHAREEFRHKLITAGACAGQICGLGTDGYLLAVRYFMDQQ